MAEMAFAIRPLPNTSLKGAFRIHLTPEALTQLNLKLNEVCLIISEDGTRGAGLAWRAADRLGNLPKVQPVKMSETMRDAWGFKQGAQVRIEKLSNDGLRLATKITLLEVTPDAYAGPEDDCLDLKCRHALFSAEAFSEGITFEISAGEGIKRRYFVENIDSSDTNQSPGLYRVNSTTVLSFTDGTVHTPSSTASTQAQFKLNTAYICGLTEQIETLNQKLRLLYIDTLKSAESRRSLRSGVLINGYNGTGKTMLLDQLAKVEGPKRIVRLSGNSLHGTPSKIQNTIQTAFQQAIAIQPSLILIDDLDQASSSSDAATVTTTASLIEALDSIRDSNILAVATSRSLSTLPDGLLDKCRLEELIELPVPDIKVRYEILFKLLSPHSEENTDTIWKIASLTHGFTGGDLARLCNKAMEDFECRLFSNAGEPLDLHETLNITAVSATQRDRSHSAATTLIGCSTASKLTVHDFKVALSKVRPSALREVILEPPKVTFDDIGGSEAMRRRFDKIIEWPSLYPEEFKTISHHKPSRGILLYGPPGCSKTMTAQAVASTYGWNFIAIQGAELISMYVGESERAIRDIFRKARQAAPTIIFFDEIDSLAGTRSGAADASKSLNVVTTLLNEMDGFEATKDVLVLAATNQPQSLDPAILRPGRFDRHIYLAPPNATARRQILQSCSEGTPGHSELDFESLVEESDGMSGAELKNAWSVACEQALDRGIESHVPVKVTTSDVSTGIIETGKQITREMLQAYEDFAANR